MPYSPELVQENDESRVNLTALINRLQDSDYNISLDEDWTVGTALAHVAFFDLRAAAIIDRCVREGVAPSDLDVEIANASLLPFLQLLTPAAIKQITLNAAATIDAKLAALDSVTADQIIALGDSAPFALSRAEHRNEHIDQIQSVL